MNEKEPLEYIGIIIMQVLCRMKKKCDKCKSAKYISKMYEPLDQTVEYVCPVCKGSGIKYIKRWITVESLLNKENKNG